MLAIWTTWDRALTAIARLPMRSTRTMTPRPIPTLSRRKLSSAGARSRLSRNPARRPRSRKPTNSGRTPRPAGIPNHATNKTTNETETARRSDVDDCGRDSHEIAGYGNDCAVPVLPSVFEIGLHALPHSGGLDAPQADETRGAPTPRPVD